MKPAAKPPSNPPPNNPPPSKPGRLAEPAAAVDVEPGGVIERSIGAAVVGAVRVGGGAENVRVPRLPPEKPPPTRAVASPATRMNAVAIAASAITQR
jgi:hypothetical protein